MAAKEFDIDLYLDLWRLSGLAVSPDGDRLVAPVARLSKDGKRFVTSLWELDPEDRGEPRQLTRSAPGESNGAFLPDGSLLFTSKRPDPDADPDDPGEAERSRLWLLPSGSGEARVVAAPVGEVQAVRAARDAAVVVFAAGILPGASQAEDAERAKERREKEIGAQLFEHYPIRWWDHFLGPRETHLYVGLDEPVDLTPDAGRALDELMFDVSADGSTVVTTWQRTLEGNDLCSDLVAIDVSTGAHRVLASADRCDFVSPAISPDGAYVACTRQDFGSPDQAANQTLWLIDVATGEGRDLTPGLDLWPDRPVWTGDGDAVLFTADERGSASVFRLEVATAVVTRLAGGAVHSSLVAARKGTAAYAVRADLGSPPRAVRLDSTIADQQPASLRTPGQPLAVAPPGTVEQVLATAEDGTEVQSWLVLPAGASAASPAPLVVFIHGGPLGAWGDWSWRWNPHLLAARGYAVLLPNPALSTGFGQAHIERGWGRWGIEPYNDILAAVDATCARPDIDETRTAAMGGSFGGYMANWVAGHTDRFRCIVTHASLWSMDQFHGTTDIGVWWEHEMGNPYVDATRYAANSPNAHIGEIRTPMLVIHGELDHRVPIGEALRLWTDLRRHGVESKFLYFPDENHWILKPQNIRIWYQTVFAWLDHYVLDEEWTRPEIL